MKNKIIPACVHEYIYIKKPPAKPSLMSVTGREKEVLDGYESELEQYNKDLTLNVGIARVTKAMSLMKHHDINPKNDSAWQELAMKVCVDNYKGFTTKYFTEILCKVITKVNNLCVFNQIKGLWQFWQLDI